MLSWSVGAVELNASLSQPYIHQKGKMSNAREGGL